MKYGCGKCEECPINISQSLRNRISTELRQECTGTQSRTKTITSETEFGVAVEQRSSTKRCPLVGELVNSFIAEGIRSDPSKKLTKLIMTNRVSLELPLGEAVRAVANGQYAHGHYYIGILQTDVEGILKNIEIPTGEELVTVHHFINGLGELSTKPIVTA